MEFESTQNRMLVQAETLLINADQYTQEDYPLVCQAISQFENRCIDEGYSRSEVDDARFFLCAFLDEQQPWHKTLITTFYDLNTNKDNEFFDRLQRRQHNPKKHTDLLELAYFCLSLGFRGKYKASPPRNGGVAVMDNLYSCIRNVRDQIPYPLAIGQIIIKKRPWRLPPVWLTIIIALAILMSIFIPYNRQLNQYMAPVLNTLQTITQADNHTHEN